MRIEGNAAIVTGGGSGMGAAAAALLAQKGAKVTLLGRRADVVEHKAEEIGGLGLPCDVANPGTIDAAFDRAEREHGPARIMVHAAADGHMAPLLLADGTLFDQGKLRQIVETNVLGTIYVNQAFASRLCREMPDGDERGVAINVSSIGADDGVVGAAYAMSKAAVNGFCLSAAREFGAFGIRVMTIAPGSIDTDMFRSGANPETYKIIESSVPHPRRLGTPDEFANLVVHICGNAYLNGSVIRLDGGMRVPFATNIGGGSEVGAQRRRMGRKP